ncbi:hypothetical protein ACWGN5_07545 [Streptomyces sp. NPDC055815]
MDQINLGSLRREFDRRSRATSDGHREWTGTTVTSSGVGRFRYQGRDYSAYQAAYILRTGRLPVGTVRPTCEHPKCCALAHVDDRAARQQVRAQYAAVVGIRHKTPKCGHDPAVHGRYRESGKRYCEACNNPPKQAAA